MPLNKIYLGDGAYAEIDHDAQEIVLTTENGIETTNRVVLGPRETVIFVEWLQDHGVRLQIKGTDE